MGATCRRRLIGTQPHQSIDIHCDRPDTWAFVPLRCGNRACLPFRQRPNRTEALRIELDLQLPSALSQILRLEAGAMARKTAKRLGDMYRIMCEQCRIVWLCSSVRIPLAYRDDMDIH